ncbi:DUF5711 family protein [Defluviitalea phaphyphila]|uniref:DUF5711 family protein n=1 Tax=Defluviitalea phaphyphila TaxID=1473580 RepID=UPI00073128BF|nr:DUF5711 family protein [Defluviitalea phaphyphila]
MIKTKKNKEKKARIFALLILIIGASILIYLDVSGSNLHFSFINGNEPSLYLEKQWVDIDSESNYIFSVYENDLIQCSPDGIKRISQEGKELWNATYSMTNPRLIINEPYIAVGEEKGKIIYVLNDKGLVYKILEDNEILYFSINSNGFLSVISETKEGHKIKIYDNKGNDIGISRSTYVEDAGYPLRAIVSNDGNSLPIIYLNPNANGLKSDLIFLDLGEDGILKEDFIDFAIAREDTVFSNMYYLKNNTLVVLGDNRILWIDENKEVKEEILNNSIETIPWNIEKKRNLSSYLVLVLSSEKMPGIEENEGNVVFYDTNGEKKYSFNSEGDVTYLYADENMVIVGVNRTFYGLNKKGKQIFKYTALKDVKDIIPLKNGKQVALISKDSVDLMEIKR